jgi:PAS domain S-box-containing protein
MGLKFEEGKSQGQSAAYINFAKKILDKENSSDVNSLFQLIIEHLPDQIYLKNDLGQFVLCNAPVARNAGCASPDEVIGKTDFDFYPYEIADKFQADEKKIMQSAVSLINHEEHYTDKKTNKVKWNLTTKIPIQNEANVIIGLLGINRDITDIKNALLDKEKILADLQKRNEELEEFTHIVSHNLRAPLANILGLLELVNARDTYTLEDNRIILENIALSAKKLDDMTHQLNGILQNRQQ